MAPIISKSNLCDFAGVGGNARNANCRSLSRICRGTLRFAMKKSKNQEQFQRTMTALFKAPKSVVTKKVQKKKKGKA